MANIPAWDVAVGKDGMVYIGMDNDACSLHLPKPVDGKVVLPVAAYPDLAKVGGTVIGRPGGFSDKLIVMRVDETTVATLSDICTHLGCDVEFVAENKSMHCPCHGSRFTTDGAVTAGPAARPLKKYECSLDAVGVTISVA
jgi:Rieske Fe-S protein